MGQNPTLELLLQHFGVFDPTAEVCFVVGVNSNFFSNDIINTGIEITGYSINQYFRVITRDLVTKISPVASFDWVRSS